MPTANEEWFDISVQHQIDLGRVQSANIQDSIQLLNETERDLRETLEKRLNRIVDVGFDTGPETTARVNRMLDQVTKIRREAHKDLDKLLTGQVTDLAEFEIEFTDSALTRILPIQIDFDLPPAERVSRAVKTKPFQGRILKDWTRGLERGDIDRLTTTIRQGIVEGLTTAAIVTSVMGTAKLGFKDGILQQSRRSITALTRTALNHAANEAREEFFKENEDIVKNLVWIAVLDGRTTPICQARSGERFPVGKGPRPPAHVACRSLMVAELDGIGLIGEQATISDTRTRRVREIDFRKDAKLKAGNTKWKSLTEKQRRGLITKERQIWADTNIGQVPAGTSYSQWLKGQPAKFQNEVLGKTRAQAFRSGDLTLDKFVDLRTGKRFTLDDLRIKATTEKLFSEGPGHIIPGFFDIKYLQEQSGLKGIQIRRKLRSLGIKKTGKIYDFGTKEEADRILKLILTGKGKVKPALPAIPGTVPKPTTPLTLTGEALRKQQITDGFNSNFKNTINVKTAKKRKTIEEYADSMLKNLFAAETRNGFKTDPRMFKRSIVDGQRIRRVEANKRTVGRNAAAHYQPDTRSINMGSATNSGWMAKTFNHEVHHWLDFTTLAEPNFLWEGNRRAWFNKSEVFVNRKKADAARSLMIQEFEATRVTVFDELVNVTPSTDRRSRLLTGGPDRFDWQKNWQQLWRVDSNKFERISDYALHDILEWVAEAGPLFYNNPTKLKRVAPKTYDLFIKWYSGDLWD